MGLLRSLEPIREDDEIPNLKQHPHLGLQASLLDRLPLEIRQEIYGHALGKQNHYSITLPLEFCTVFNRCAFLTEEPNSIHNDTNDGPTTGKGRGYNWPPKTALLRTCRQIHIEAIAVFYAHNTFTAQQPEGWIWASKRIPAHCLNSPRCLLFSWSPLYLGNWSGWQEYEQHRMQWQTFWVATAAIKQLKTLDFQLALWASEHCSHRDQSVCHQLLRPLLHLRGLRHCRANVGIVGGRDAAGRIIGDVPLHESTGALLEQIETVAKLPREDSASDTD
ncbi:MAG: hypothetical protein Q9197_000814 [Variospora fuerteventurae]